MCKRAMDGEKERCWSDLQISLARGSLRRKEPSISTPTPMLRDGRVGGSAMGGSAFGQAQARETDMSPIPRVWEGKLMGDYTDGTIAGNGSFRVAFCCV